MLRRYAQAGADDIVVLMRRPHTPVSFAASRSLTRLGHANVQVELFMHANLHAHRGCSQMSTHSWLQANAPQYWRIDISQPLCSQLQGRTVIEFPTLLV